ncbi:MAG: hypothetical protein NTW19_03290, partial [Planctomycetota bacterium]|nr:hypothetical protein [Planctomycetota bacterium]
MTNTPGTARTPRRNPRNRRPAAWLGLESLERRALLTAAPLAETLGVLSALASRGDIPAMPAAVIVTNQSSLDGEGGSLGSFYLPAQRRLNKPGAFLTGPTSGAPLDIARAYLEKHAMELGLSVADLRSAKVTNQYTDEGTGITHIYMRQMSRGLEVMNADLSVNITAKGEVINVGSGFVAGLGSGSGGGGGSG